MNERDTPLPLTYRADLLRHVMPAVRAGECCSLVGTSGAGKSNLVRFLQRPDVQQHYWGDEPVWVVMIDTNGLVFDTAPDVYAVAELMIHRLIREAERRHLDNALIANFDARYLQLVKDRNPLLAFRCLERICGQLCEAVGVRLVFLFDQFEDLWETGDARLFLHLRYLRDEFKYRLSYMVMTRERLQRVLPEGRTDLTEVESFWELFSAHTYGLGPYSTDDASHMIDRIAARQRLVANDHVREVVITASGGHSGLLRALFWALHSDPQHSTKPDDLLKLGTVAEECAKIWSDLLPDEQQTLREIVLNAPSIEWDEDSLHDLRLKKVVDTQSRIFAPIFGAYLLGLTGDMSGLVLNVRLRQVWLERNLLTKLSKLEFNLLEFLVRNTDRVCSREEILHNLYAKDNVHMPLNANDERLDALIRRLREALGETATKPYYLITHRGVGFQFKNGRVQE